MRISYDLFKKRYYYTLTDLLNIGRFKKKLFGIETIKDIIDSVFTDYIETRGMYFYDGVHSNNLWQLLYAKYKNQFIMISDRKPEDLSIKEIFDGLEPIFTRIQETYPKWDTLLTKYASTTDFFKPIKNVVSFGSTNRFNDTPQIASGYEGDSYASNYTKINSDTISENDVNSVMARIMEVDLNYKNLLEEWAKSMFDLFIEEANISGEDVSTDEITNNRFKEKKV